MSGRAAAAAWAGYAAAAGLLAAIAVGAWVRAAVSGGPVLYGEGAVAHAATLARGFATYADPGAAAFTAANYPPLYFALDSVGDPFFTGRVMSVVATLLVAAAVAWRARAAGPVVAVALAAGWLALAPVVIWGPAVKPDLVALALTVVAVLCVERRRIGLAAALLVLAMLAKPTAALPAVALVAWIAARDRTMLRTLATAGAIAVAVAAIAILPFGYPDLWRHVVAYNALDWSAQQAALLAFLGIVVLIAAVGGAIVARGLRGPIGAYCAAGAAIVLLGGREGATINYLLDLAAGVSLALAAAAPAIARTAAYPLAALANLALATALLDPLGIVPGRAPTTGAWGDPSRLAAVRSELGSDAVVLAEDSGLLVATGHRVVVDDLFLWSRLVARAAVDPGSVLTDVRAARFTAIVAETDLARLDDAPAYERSRWEPSLVRAIVERYRLDSRSGGLFVYRPR